MNIFDFITIFNGVVTLATTNKENIALSLIFVPLIILWPLFYYLFHVKADMTKGLKPKTTIYFILGVLGVLADFLVNLFWGTFLFCQLPNVNRLMISARMDEIIKNTKPNSGLLNAWRFWLALRIVGILLEPYDKTGQHTTYGQWPVKN